MKKSLLLSLLVLLSACAGEPKETYPYGMSEKEWNELSINCLLYTSDAADE